MAVTGAHTHTQPAFESIVIFKHFTSCFFLISTGKISIRKFRWKIEYIKGGPVQSALVSCIVSDGYTKSTWKLFDAMQLIQQRNKSHMAEIIILWVLIWGFIKALFDLDSIQFWTKTWSNSVLNNIKNYIHVVMNSCTLDVGPQTNRNEIDSYSLRSLKPQAQFQIWNKQQNRIWKNKEWKKW